MKITDDFGSVFGVWLFPRSKKANQSPGNFVNETSVRITYPVNGAVLTNDFELLYEVGNDIKAVKVRANGN